MAANELIGVVIGGVIGLAAAIFRIFNEKYRAQKSARAMAFAEYGVLRIEEITPTWFLYQLKFSHGLQGILSSDELFVRRILVIYLCAPVDEDGLLEPDIAKTYGGHLFDGSKV